LNRFYEKATGVYETIKSIIVNFLVVSADETGCKINGEKYWVCVWQTTQL
jgi:hypothetical protein